MPHAEEAAELLRLAAAETDPEVLRAALSTALHGVAEMAGVQQPAVAAGEVLRAVRGALQP
jgi:hypothetical protein